MDICTVEDYREWFSTSVSMEQMEGAHQEIKIGLRNVRDDAAQKEGARIWEKLWKHSLEYMQDRLSEQDGQRGITQRSELHNVINDSVREMAKLLRAQGQQTKYLEEIDDRDERGQGNGDFACYIVFVESLCRR